MGLVKKFKLVKVFRLVKKFRPTQKISLGHAPRTEARRGQTQERRTEKKTPRAFRAGGGARSAPLGWRVGGAPKFYNALLCYAPFQLFRWGVT